MSDSQQKNYITLKGLIKLKAEYQFLVQEERPKVVETVAWAAGNGDRSENGDYIYGKKRLREIDRRLRYLGKKIESAYPVDPQKMTSEKVVFSATVTVEYETGELRVFQIVGEDEIDTKGGKISWKSPMAKSLLGKQVGDEVSVKTPKEEVWLEITKISFDESND
ncbi:MAG: transcription elongation factor GreB [Bdellovibrionales bacterium]|nr:transcription elongation factor GreB [Bdellovibrionales bacterium]